MRDKSLMIALSLCFVVLGNGAQARCAAGTDAALQTATFTKLDSDVMRERAFELSSAGNLLQAQDAYEQAIASALLELGTAKNGYYKRQLSLERYYAAVRHAAQIERELADMLKEQSPENAALLYDASAQLEMTVHTASK